MTDTTADSASPAPDPDEQRPDPAVPATNETVTPPSCRAIAHGHLAGCLGGRVGPGRDGRYPPFRWRLPGRRRWQRRRCVAPSEAFAPFCDAYAKLQGRSTSTSWTTAKLAEGAIQGMFEHGVQDPFSGYMPPEDYQRALGDLSGQFSGIGAEMGVRNPATRRTWKRAPTSATPARWWSWRRWTDSPAEKAGLKAGDFVTRRRRRKRRTGSRWRTQVTQGPRRVGHRCHPVAACATAGRST